MKRTPKTTQCYFRMTPAERRLMERAAGIDRKTLSDFIRIVAIDRAKEIIRAEKKGRRQKSWL